MAAFKSPFEKLSVESQQAMVAQLSPGGELFGLFEEILSQLQDTEKRIQKDEAKTKVSLFAGLTMKEAIAWKLLGEKGLMAIGKGLGAIAEVIDGMESSGKEAKEKMDAIATGIEACMGIGPAILKFAFYMLLATPLLIASVVAAPLFGIAIYLVLGALSLATSTFTKKTAETLTMLGDVGKAIFWFGGYLALSLLVYPFALMAMLIVVPTIALVAWLMNMTQFMITKKTMKRMAMLGDVGKAIFHFGAALALSLLIYPFALLAMLVVVPTILLVALIFNLMRPLAKGMKKTARALKMAGVAIVILGLAIFAFGLLFPPTKKSFMTLGMVALVVIGIAFSFWLVGKMAGSIFKGSLVLILTSISLIILAISIKQVGKSLATLGDPWEFMLQLGIMIVVLGLAMAGWGMGFSLIAQGALGMILSGIGLILLGVGLEFMAEALKASGDPWEFMLQVGAFLVGMGLMAAGWGAGAILIIPGAVAMAAAGGGLAILALGLTAMGAFFKGKAWKDMVATHHESDGFFGIGGGPVSNLTELITSIGWAFLWNPVSAGFILGGSVAMLAAGGALASVAGGLKKMEPVFKSGVWKDMIATHHVDKGFFGGETPISNLAHIISQVGAAFSLGLGSFSIVGGAGAMVVAGRALGKIAAGLGEWQKWKIDTKIAANVKSMVMSLAKAFGEIGKKYGGAGFFGLGAGPLYNGIQSTRGMGKALTSIAYGMKAFANLRFPTYGDPNDPGKITEYITLDKGAMATITANVTMMVYSLSNAFGLIGTKFPNQPGSGLFGFLGGTTNPVQQGIQSTMGMGKALGGIAEGMKSFSELKFYKYDDPSNPEKITEVIDLTKGNAIKKVTDNIVYMVSALSGAFAQIGIKYPKKKASGMAGWLGFTTAGPVGVGIEQSGGMGGVVSEIAKGMKDFSELKFPQYEGTKLTGYIDLTKGSVLKKVTKNIVNIILSLASGFGEVARRFPRRAYTTWWGATRYAPDGSVGEGVKQSQGIGGVLTEIAGGLKDFSELKFPRYKGDKIVGYTTLTSSGMKKVTKNIVNMIVSLMHGFGQIGKKYPAKKASGWLGEMGVMMPGAVGQGIGAAKYLGRVLGNTARGLSWFAVLKFPIYKGTKVVGYETMNGDAPKKIAKNIAQMIYYPMDAFGKIGKKYPMTEKAPGLLGKLGVMLPGAPGAGIAAAKYLGRRLASIAIGYAFLAKLKFPEYDDPSDPDKITGYKTLAGYQLKPLGKNIYQMIYYPMAAFGKIGDKYGADISWLDKMRGTPKGGAMKGMMIAKNLPGAMGLVFGALRAAVSDPNIVNLGKTAADTMVQVAKAVLGFDKIGPVRIFLLGEAVEWWLRSWAKNVKGMKSLLFYQGLQKSGAAMETIAKAYGEIGDVGPHASLMLGKLTQILHKAKLIKQAIALKSIAKSYKSIGETAKDMNIEALKETTQMFKALAYLSEKGGEGAIEALGEELIGAIELLGDKFKEFAQIVAEGQPPVNPPKDGEPPQNPPVQQGGPPPVQQGGGGGGTTVNIDLSEVEGTLESIEGILSKMKKGDLTGGPQ